MKEIILPADMYNIIAYQFGLIGDEITITNTFGSLKFIKAEINEEKKMTREEAIKKHANAVHDPQQCYYNEQLITSEFFVKGLEAFGLIKFEEEKKEKNLEFYAPMSGTCYIGNKELIKHLKEQGYTVTKNG